MRPFVDSDREAEIEWYFVNDNTPFLVGGSAIGSLNWGGTDFPSDGVGEVLGAARPWRNGSRRWFAPLGEPAGPQEWIQAGAPFEARGTLPVDDLGVPVACGGNTVLADFHRYRNASQAPYGDVWYPGQHAPLAVTNGDPQAAFEGQLLVPLFVVQSVRLTGIGVWSPASEQVPATPGHVPSVRFALYSSRSVGELWPDALVVQSPEIFVDTEGPAQVIKHDMDITLAQGLYWLGFQQHKDPLFDGYVYVSGAVPTPGNLSFTNVLGFKPMPALPPDDAFTLFVPLCGIQRVHSFDPWPDPWPDYVTGLNRYVTLSGNYNVLFRDEALLPLMFVRVGT